jgi:preprotein translocase subunit SecD
MRRIVPLVCGLAVVAACLPLGRRPAAPPKAGEPKVGAPKAAAPPAVEFRLAEDKPARGTRAMTIKGSTETVHVYKTPVLDARDVESASTRKSLWMDQSYSITIALTPAGARKLEKVSTDNVGKRLAILVADKVVSAPIIRTPILHGSAVIEGGKTTEQEANSLAALINAAARK